MENHGAIEELKTSRHFPFPFSQVRWLPLFLFCALCLASLPVSAYRVTVEAPGPLKDLLTEFLDLVRYQDREDLNVDQFNYMLATVDEEVRKLAATEGYFSPTTTVEVERDAEPMLVRIKVEAGPRVRVSDVDLEVTGATATQSPEQVRRVHRAWPLQKGEPFRQEEWNQAKQEGLQILQRRRYAAARIASSEARIYADEYEAELDVTYDSGPVFTLGAPRVTGTRRYPESIVENVNPLDIGEEYSTERLLELQRQVLRTPYFSNVLVSIDRDPANATQAPINVEVTEFPTQRIRGGAGYATDTGARLDGRYSHNNVFGRAWVFEGQTRLEQRRQFGSLDLAMPPGRKAYVNSIHTSIERTTLEGIELNSRRVGVRRARSTDTADTAYSIQYYSDHLQQLDGAAIPPEIFVQPGTHRALVTSIARTRRRVDNPAFPRRGNIIAWEAGVAVKGLLSDETFFRAYSRLRQYLPVGRRDLVILRGELGAVISQGDDAAIPASLLFRAGGTDSVRGYGFQSIGNVQNGTVYPTRFLLTGGVEYQHWFSEEWGGAVFYDVGTAIDDWNSKDFFHGAGVGARWRSPVGRVNLDLAYGFQENRLRPHLSLGIAF